MRDKNIYAYFYASITFETKRRETDKKAYHKIVWHEVSAKLFFLFFCYSFSLMIQVRVCMRFPSCDAHCWAYTISNCQPKWVNFITVLRICFWWIDFFSSSFVPKNKFQWRKKNITNRDNYIHRHIGEMCSDHCLPETVRCFDSFFSRSFILEEKKKQTWSRMLDWEKHL